MSLDLYLPVPAEPKHRMANQAGLSRPPSHREDRIDRRRAGLLLLLLLGRRVHDLCSDRSGVQRLRPGLFKYPEGERLLATRCPQVSCESMSQWKKRAQANQRRWDGLSCVIDHYREDSPFRTSPTSISYDPPHSVSQLHLRRARCNTGPDLRFLARRGYSGARPGERCRGRRKCVGQGGYVERDYG